MWQNTSEAAQQLNFSTKHLARLREQGILKKGKHWRNIAPNSIRPTYQWDVEEIEKFFKSINL